MARKFISRPVQEAQEWLHQLAGTLGWEDIEKVKRALGALLRALDEPRPSNGNVRREIGQGPPGERVRIHFLLDRVLRPFSRDDSADPGERERAVFDLLFPGQLALERRRRR